MRCDAMQRIYSFLRACRTTEERAVGLHLLAARTTRAEMVWYSGTRAAAAHAMRCDATMTPPPPPLGSRSVGGGEVRVVHVQLTGSGWAGEYYVLLQEVVVGGSLHGAYLEPGGCWRTGEERVGRALAIVVLLMIPRIGHWRPALARSRRMHQCPPLLAFLGWAMPAVVGFSVNGQVSWGLTFPLFPRLWRLVSLSC